MAKRRLGIMAIVLFVCLSCLPYTVLAASTTDAKEPIVLDTECELKISYSYDGQGFPNQSVNLYKIAEVTEDFQYALTPYFISSSLVLNGIQTNGEWDVIRSTLDVHILVNNIVPITTAVTDKAGQAHFTQLTPGLYLVSAVNVVQDNLTCSFDSALVSLPGLGADGFWQYQINVSAKPEILPPVDSDEEITFKVLKLWRGDEHRTDRPKSIEVEIFRNETSYKTVILSEENHWSYSWTAKADGASWNVTERNIPTGYTMTIEQRDNTFVLTNTHQDKPNPSQPQTGDTSNVLLYSVLMYISGTMLILLAIVGKRKRHEETN